MNAQNSGTMRGRFKRRRLPSTLGQHINDLLDDAAALRSRRDIDAAWMLLEDAHVLSQPWVRPHLRVHMAMLSLGWSQRNRSEVVGQLGRLIVAGPGSAFGRYPVGNTGRAAVSAFEPMPIRGDLALLLNDPEHSAQGDTAREPQLPPALRDYKEQIALYKFTGSLGGLALKAYAKRRKPTSDPAAAQTRQLLELVEAAKDTTFGLDHDFAAIETVADYQQRVPIRTFDDFWVDYWSGPFPLLENVTWPGSIRYFARSSGTTTGESKHIPCSDEMVKANNRGGLEVVLAHLQNNPNSRVSAGRTFLFGGSPALDELAPGVFAGELSGIAARETPAVAGVDRYYPPPDLAAISDWNEKVERFGQDCVGKNIRAISGVPTWLQVLFDHAFDTANCQDRRLVSLFPNLELITHGGINFAPYETAFNDMLEGSHAELREVYAASEGFIAVADRGSGEGMRLLLDNGLFFEFIEADQLDEPNPRRHWINDVQLDTNYALILTSCAGLWSYAIGDLVRFVDLEPPRVLVAGRVSQTLSTFGEHITGEQLDIAVATSAQQLGLHVNDFAVAPVLATTGTVGHHRYVIETDPEPPGDLAALVDNSLAEQNADYRTKRANNIVIAPPQVDIVPNGTFASWMAANGQAGGQRKVPRVTTPQRLDQIVQTASTPNDQIEPEPGPIRS